VSNVIRAWYQALNYAYAHQADYPLTTCLHARFTRNSPALLSPAYSTATNDRCCWIEILSAYPKADPDAAKRANSMRPHRAMINAIMPGWVHSMNGRPHWAKNWQYIEPALDMRALYPAANLETFNALRRQLDPGGMFLSPILKQQNLFW